MSCIVVFVVQVLVFIGSFRTNQKYHVAETKLLYIEYGTSDILSISLKTHLFCARQLVCVVLSLHNLNHNQLGNQVSNCPDPRGRGGVCDTVDNWSITGLHNVFYVYGSLTKYPVGPGSVKLEHLNYLIFLPSIKNSGFVY